MTGIETGIIVTMFLAIIGCYAFTFTAWRGVNNHVYSKLDKLARKFDKFCLEVTDRLARIETTLGVKKKE